MTDEVFDALVIGAGFGGLGAALTLAEAGARVCLCETLRYPGGCASTFSRDGYRFDAGATLVSGLGPGQLFGDWIARHALEVDLEWMDPLLELRAPGVELTIRRDRGALLEDLCRLEAAPAQALRAFFAEQRRVADVLWSLFDDPSFLPPLSGGSLLRHADKLAELHTGMTCRIGIPVEQLAHGYHQNVSSPIYSTGIGLLLRGLIDVESGRVLPEPEVPQAISDAKKEPSNAEEKSGTWFDSVFRKTKEWFEADPEVDLEKNR